ncbi:hypothetical protein HDU91_006425 [Kappamyces sp. JEL0680]|nr:hypothetical protein HDU91_006425 [Kappamyces sp. JEL0680]
MGRMQVIASFGKHLAQQIPQGTVGPNDELPPYEGGQTTRKIHEDFDAAMEQCKRGSLPRPHNEGSYRQNDFRDNTGGSKNSLSAPAPSQRSPSPRHSNHSSPQMSAVSSSYQQATVPPLTLVTGNGSPHLAPPQDPNATHPLPPIPGGMPPASHSTLSSGYSQYSPPVDVAYSQYYTINTAAPVKIPTGMPPQPLPDGFLYAEHILCARCQQRVLATQMTLHLESRCQEYVAR